MRQVVCPHCGRLMDTTDRAPGQTMVCSGCGEVSEISGRGRSSSASAWSNSVDGGAGEDSTATELHTVSRTPPRRRADPMLSPAAIYSLLGMAIFLLVLIGAVATGRYARRLLVRPEAAPRPTTVAQWIGQLANGPGRQARQQAARALADHGPEAILAALDATTQRPDSDTAPISAPVVRALAEVGPGLAGTLGRALSSPKPNVRVAAAGILREMGPQSRDALRPLIGALGDEHRWVRRYAAGALGNLGAEARDGVAALQKLTQDQEPEVRAAAEQALKRIDTPGAR